jgi:SAM-dependent methyltransferase
LSRAPPDASRFWDQQQPGFRFSHAAVGSPEFFAEVEAHRYTLEPHIPDVVRFERWGEHEVLEAGCGIATDGLRFARAGARYTGLDRSETALELANRRFELEDRPGRFVAGSVTELPFEDDSFDLVYSHGVIHHVPDTRAAVEELHRVVRPGGVVLAMVYHRGSLNYLLNVMVLRRALVGLLLAPGAAGAISKATGEDRAILDRHRELLQEHGVRYLRDRSLFLSRNTDGPDNPLSKVYSRAEAKQLFGMFARVGVQTRFLNLRIYPGGERLARTVPARRLERRVGWHLWVEAHKER